MSDLQRIMRQLRSVIRLRSFRREQAEQAWRCAEHQTSLIERSLRDETVRYRMALKRYQVHLAQGSALNLDMLQCRQSALGAVSALIAERQLALGSARRQSTSAKDRLSRSCVDVEYANRSRQRIAEAIVRQRQAMELTDILDAQYRQGGLHGD